MTREIRVRGVRRKQLDEDKLAYAFLLLARTLQDQRHDPAGLGDSDETSQKPEVA